MIQENAAGAFLAAHPGAEEDLYSFLSPALSRLNQILRLPVRRRAVHLPAVRRERPAVGST